PKSQAEVAESHVEVVAEDQEVEDDAYEPGGDDVREDPGLERHADSSDDLDHANDVHESLSADQVADEWSEVLRPVGEQIGELVEAGDDGCHRESQMQDSIRLMNGRIPRDCFHDFLGCVEPLEA